MNSREKGKRGERQWRDELRANGYLAWRGQQFSGSADSPDVVCDSLPWAHFEVKLVERLDLYGAMEQARRDARSAAARDGATGARGEGKVPVVAHRRRYWPWLVTMEAETLFRLRRGDFTGENRGNGEGAADGMDLLPEAFCAGWVWAACFTYEGGRLSIHEAMARAERSAGGRAVVFAHRCRGGRWLITVTAETFFRLLRGDLYRSSTLIDADARDFTEANEGNEEKRFGQGAQGLGDLPDGRNNNNKQ